MKVPQKHVFNFVNKIAVAGAFLFGCLSKLSTHTTHRLGVLVFIDSGETFLFWTYIRCIGLAFLFECTQRSRWYIALVTLIVFFLCSRKDISSIPRTLDLILKRLSLVFLFSKLKKMLLECFRHTKKLIKLVNFRAELTDITAKMVTLVFMDAFLCSKFQYQHFGLHVSPFTWRPVFFVIEGVPMEAPIGNESYGHCCNIVEW